MKNKQHLSRMRALWMVLWIATAGILRSAPLYDTSFIGANGTLPADWAVISGDTFGTAAIQSNALVVTRAADESSQRHAMVFTGLDSQEGNSAAWTDVTVLVRMRGTNLNVDTARHGVMLRYTHPTTGQGYWASLAGSTLRILRNEGMASDAGTYETQLNSVTFTTVSNNTWYWLEFSAVGSSLTASAFLDDNGSRGTLLGTVSATDSTFTAGTVGIRNGFTSTGTRSATYDSLVVIPEPSTAILLLLGFSSALLLRRTGRS